MPAKNTSECDTVDLTSAYTDADGTFTADLQTEANDDDTTQGINAANISKIGKGGSPHGHAVRCIYSDGIGDLQVGDTFTVYITSIHNTPNMNILAYTTSSTVTATGEIQISISTGANVFTLTSGFIAALVDLGSGSFGIRFVETNNPGGGDIQIAEVDADFSTGGGEPPAATRRRHLLRQRRRR